MNFLANENFPFPGINLLREAGFHVRSISETNPGISDDEVIEIASRHNLIILTFDKDYGEIIFRLGVPNPPAVVFFRYKGENPYQAATNLIRLIESKTPIEEGFTVVEKEAVRLRKYNFD